MFWGIFRSMSDTVTVLQSTNQDIYYYYYYSWSSYLQTQLKRKTRWKSWRSALVNSSTNPSKINRKLIEAYFSSGMNFALLTFPSFRDVLPSCPRCPFSRCPCWLLFCISWVMLLISHVSSPGQVFYLHFVNCFNVEKGAVYIFYTGEIRLWNGYRVIANIAGENSTLSRWEWE